ncbi:MAG: hypothetical protein KC620_01020, partial [Myxococcales bacterium]|nr:hypothetical protein [Myxococcales bacterium]
MRRLLMAVAAFSLFACAGRPVPAPSAPVEAAPPETPVVEAPNAVDPLPPCEMEDDECRVNRLGDTSLGWLKAGLSREALTERLGKPAEENGPFEEGATGEFVTTVSWPTAGIEGTLSANDAESPATLRDYTVQAPFAEKTERGIGIGSTEAEVRAAYGDAFDPRSSGLV